MGKTVGRIGMALAVVMALLAGCRQETPRKVIAPSVPAVQNVQAGEALFNQYCAPCHPDGGNVSDPGRTLHGSSLRANQINRPEDIVRIMRNPISRMIRFDASTVSDQDAMAIAAYIMTTFK